MTKFFAFDAITEEEVLEQFLQLNPSKAPGPENIAIKNLRALATIILPYMSNIFIECFERGTFPATLKNAKIIPIHKARQKNVASNYRPISLIHHCQRCWKNCYILGLKNSSNQQFRFRRGYSMEMPIADLHNNLLNNINEGYFSSCKLIFLGLSKAFDTVNYQSLLNKLYMYGIRGNMHDLAS